SIPLLSHASTIQHVHIGHAYLLAGIKAAFLRVLTYHRDFNNPLQEQLAANALEEILLLLTASDSSSMRHVDSRVTLVLNHLAQYYPSICRVEDLARMVNLSPSRLSHLFKLEVGETMLEVLTKHRLKQAERLLSFSSRAITDISYDVGFQSPDYFTRTFKAYYQVSPRSYRRRLHLNSGPPAIK
ncbi:MAG: helix-turn-helix domain-containing protein, partial [Gorillibacterium sp.]|nr:helix-turn-helix domain-containing protein [Gorillibacterium sp.]